MKSLKFLVLALVLPLLSNAQTGWDIGLLVGIANYQGDLAKSTLPSLDQSNLAIGLSVKNYITTTIAVEGNLNFAKIDGSDLNFPEDGFRRQRAVSFESSIAEFSVVGEWEPLGESRFLASTGNQVVISPYAFLGLGLSIVDPQVDYSEFNGDDSLLDLINSDIVAGESNFKMVIPIGIGLKIDISKEIQLGLEAGLRYPFTDYLDGISLAGNPDRNDLYIISGINIVYMMKK